MPARINGKFALCALTAALGCFFLSGCGKNKEDAPANQGTNAQTKNTTSTIQANTIDQGIIPQIGLLPFKDAVLFEPPDGERRPPDKTVGGKNVATLFEQIGGQEGAPGLWDQTALTTPDGRPIQYTAHLKTDQGTIEIELFSQAAPNHVRNFIALAKAGFYNGLPFYRSINEKVEGVPMAYLEGGCPLGTGEFGFGSIGYWLRPEISPTLTHEEGTVGAVHGEDVESAACKFYISLTRARGMDGNYTIFGKITKGLDIAQAINKRPVVDEGDLNDRPREPVIIREVTIQAGVGNHPIVARNP